MLVTSRDTGRWVLPKGWAEKELSCPQVAEKEAFEEAGIVGVIQRKKMATYSYWKRLPKKRGVTCNVDVFAMRVTELLDDWPEKTQRERKWFTPGQAAMEVEEEELILLLLELAVPAN